MPAGLEHPRIFDRSREPLGEVHVVAQARCTRHGTQTEFLPEKLNRELVWLNGLSMSWGPAVLSTFLFLQFLYYEILWIAIAKSSIWSSIGTWVSCEKYLAVGRHIVGLWYRARGGVPGIFALPQAVTGQRSPETVGARDYGGPTLGIRCIFEEIWVLNVLFNYGQFWEQYSSPRSRHNLVSTFLPCLVCIRYPLKIRGTQGYLLCSPRSGMGIYLIYTFNNIKSWV